MVKQAGLSLSEVLISLFLSSVIMAALIQFYLASKQGYVQAEKVLETGFEVQWVADLLSDSIRRAGFTPCQGLDHLTVVDHRHDKHAVRALVFENQPAPFIQVTRMKDPFATLLNIENATTLLIEHLGGLNDKRPLLIADCEHAEIHELAGIQQQDNETRLLLKKPLLHGYETSTYVGEFVEERWFIKKKANSPDTLYYLGGQREELSALVHSLAIAQKATSHQPLLEVTLGLDEGKSHKFLIAVRGS